MILCRVIGNAVSTVHHRCFDNKSVLVVPWVDLGSFANVVILTGVGGGS